MKRSVWLPALAVVVLLAVLAAGAFYYFDTCCDAPVAEPQTAAPPAPEGPIERPAPVAVTPVPEPEPPVPLPELDASDGDVQSALGEDFGAELVARFLIPERVVRNVVVTIDNLPRDKVALQRRPVKPTPGTFATSGSEEAPVLSPENYARYSPFVRAVEAADARMVVAFYRRFYPLFQQAYEELGYPNRDFTERLLEVIDHLVNAPDVTEPVGLARPSVLFQFADKTLESSSAGRKLLIRMGADNARIVKTKLREIRAELGGGQTAAR